MMYVQLKPIIVLLVRAIWGRKIAVMAMRRPILTGAGVLVPKNGATEMTGAMRIRPRKNSDMAEIGAYSES